MEITAKEFYKQIEDFSNNKIRQKEDLERIIDYSFRNNQSSLLEEAAFFAKYLQGLLGIIQRGESAVNEEVFERYRKEYTENLEKLKKNLTEIIKHADPFYKSIFSEKYLQIKNESIQNLTDLCFDLSWVKMYLNVNKNR